jgi:two-component system response regulator (stage 0 sporulation protein F)
MVGERSAKPYRILVSDDDPRCREAVREALEPRGYSTELVSCGSEAIQLVRRRLVHVVIVDMNMPDMTGVDTVLIIRREITAELPSILMSGDDPQDVMRQALDAHFDSFLHKPFDIVALREIVDEIIRRHYEPS